MEHDNEYFAEQYEDYDDYGQEFYDDYEDDYEDEYYDPDYYDEWVQEPVPLMVKVRHWLIAKWWRIRNKLGLPVPYDDIPF